MKLLDMTCPHDWDNCSECVNKILCIAGLYEPDISDLGIVVLAAKIAEEVVIAAVIESVHNTKGTWFEKFNQMSEKERWADYRKHHIADLTYKEPITCMGGPTSPGGGSSNNVKKNNKGTIPTVYVWGSTD